MGDLPYESLVGVSVGLPLGFAAAVLAGLATIVSNVVWKRAIPTAIGATLVIVLTLAAGLSVGLLDVGAISQVPRLVSLSIVAGLLGVVATSHGNRIATELPLDRTLPIVRGQALSEDGVDTVDAMGQVTIRPTSVIRSFDGYPPHSPPIRTAIEEDGWRFPADLQLAELERRLELRLRAEYGFAQVDVSINGRGLATISAAPPAKGVATALSAGTRAVTISGILPTGVEPGDEVSIWATGSEIRGTVLATTKCGVDPSEDIPLDASKDARNTIDEPGVESGTGWLTVAIPTARVGEILDVETPRIAVRPSGDNHAYEAIALLERAGRPVLEVEHPDDEPFEADETLAIAVDDRWSFDEIDSVPERVDRSFVISSAGSLRDRSSKGGSRKKEVSDRPAEEVNDRPTKEVDDR